MDEHPNGVTEDRILFLERKRVVLEDLGSPGRILDIGGGGEGIIGRLMGQGVVSIDTSMEELSGAPPGPLKIRMDASKMDFPGESFGLVTSFFSLLYIRREKHPRVFREVFRVLTSGGRFIAWDVDLPRRGPGPRDIGALPLLAVFPDGSEVLTGYGVPLPPKKQDLAYYLELGRKTGFRVMFRKDEAPVFSFELMKP